jgi:hypothetical protein
MAQSRFCLKSYGLLQLNNQTLNTNTTGTLFVNNVNVDINRVEGYTGGNGGLSFTSFNDEPQNNLGGQFLVLNDSTGNVVTNTFGLNAFTDKGMIVGLQAHNGNNYISFNPIGNLILVSNSSGIYLTAPDRIQLDTPYISLNTSEINFNTSKVSSNYSDIDQLNSITSSVECLKPFGHIITVSATTTTQGSSTFNVINNIVTVNSLIQLSINKYTGTQGLPSVYISNITTGNFDINISNHSITNPLNGSLKLAYSIMN